ncbi:exopolysaccharide phosphotransferase [Acrocarpospora corrugata]|uniref:Exopolysaccharide phosphotransferase n=1 Tax=Acrocarpospora corrugata TaxID=35763 RepID=A0A5M3VWV1_9ACTN|nr:stealth family protein [Acrocarpospora corrugata]GES00430.1 exopolysaccharide phosphotransferase [Acrocarpospora corrugata]
MPVGTLYRQLQGRLGARETASPRSALIRADLSPLQAVRETFDLVCQTLTEAGVPFFCVRPLAGRPPVVAVRASHRPRALTALARPGLYAGRLPAGRNGMRQPDCDRVRPLRRNDLADARVIRLARYFSTPSRTLTLGPEAGVDLEFWHREGELLVAPRPNRACEAVPVLGATVDGREELFVQLAAGGGRTYPTRPEFLHRLVDELDFPIDAVYTWVDGGDPVWRARRDLALTGGLSELATTEARFVSRDELRYSLRSLMTYAPWVRKIWIVTDQQRPSWLRPDDRIQIVDHKEIFRDPGVLPVFNSHAIEAQLHRIEGLSEHFLYLNDDFFLGRPLYPEMFFEGNGITRFFPSAAQVPFALYEDNPVHAAGMNNRRLLEELCGRTLTQKMKHVPYALRRSLLFELEDRFAEAFEETTRSAFRRGSDIAVVSSLAHYYGYLSGRAIPGTVHYTYVDLAMRKAPAKMRRMLAAREHDAYCLNDTAATTPEQDALTHRFLEAYYPVPSPFEAITPE